MNLFILWIFFYHIWIIFQLQHVKVDQNEKMFLINQKYWNLLWEYWIFFIHFYTNGYFKMAYLYNKILDRKCFQIKIYNKDEQIIAKKFFLI
jgi:hypothetical protein